jgi:hypothetical protein
VRALAVLTEPFPVIAGDTTTVRSITPAAQAIEHATELRIGV